MYQTMSFHNYTPELKDLVDCGFPIFTDSWSTYIPEYKRILEQKIVDNYLFNQICCPEPERFRHYINTQLETIMPYYNKLYQSELIEFNPLLNHSIMTEKRTIENLVKEANQANSNIGKQVRDFISSAEGRRNDDEVTHSDGIRVTEGTDITNYNKSGREDYNEHGTETGTTQSIEKQTGTQTEDTLTSGTVTDRGNEHTVQGGQDVTTTDMSKVTDGTENKSETSTSSSTGNGKEDITKSDNGTEGTTTTGDSTKDTTLNENSTSTGTKKYSDTPQKNLSDDSILSTYLTNYTGTTDTTTKDGTGKEITEYNEQKDTTTKNDGTENKVTENTTEENGEKTSDATSNETEKQSGDVTTKYGGTKDTNTDNTRTTNMNEDKTITKNLTTTTDTTRNLADDKTGNKTWSETGDETRTTNENEKTVVDGSTISSGTTFNNTQEKGSNVSSIVSSEKSNTAQTTDTGDTMSTQGYFNVSASHLLMAFRETFLNIDKMIIEELAENFMGVY